MKFEKLRDIVFSFTFWPFVLPAFAFIMVSAVLYAAAVTLLYLFFCCCTAAPLQYCSDGFYHTTSAMLGLSLTLATSGRLRGR